VSGKIDGDKLARMLGAARGGRVRSAGGAPGAAQAAADVATRRKAGRLMTHDDEVFAAGWELAEAMLVVPAPGTDEESTNVSRKIAALRAILARTPGGREESAFRSLVWGARAASGRGPAM
jgi:hypothetical protein